MAENATHGQEYIQTSIAEIEHEPARMQYSESNPDTQSDIRSTIEQLQTVVNSEAKSSSETSFADAPLRSTTPSYSQHKEMKNTVYLQQLNDIRGQLPAQERILSKIMHNKAINAVAAATANTLGRPSSLLTAGIFALGGSAFVLLLSHKYGFSYNYSVFIFLLIIGYVAGLITEGFKMLFKKTRH